MNSLNHMTSYEQQEAGIISYPEAKEHYINQIKCVLCEREFEEGEYSWVHDVPVCDACEVDIHGEECSQCSEFSTGGCFNELCQLFKQIKEVNCEEG